MTGKKSDSSPLPSSRVAELAAELAWHEEAAERLEQQGNEDTYHHQRAAQIRAELKSVEVRKDGKLD